MLVAHFRIDGHVWPGGGGCRFITLSVGALKITVHPWGGHSVRQGWIAATEVRAMLHRQYLPDLPREVRLRLGKSPLATLAHWMRRRTSTEKNRLSYAYYHQPQGKTEIRF